MNLVRWDPFRELEGIQARLNRLFPGMSERTEDETLFAGWSPAVDIQETDNEFILKADLPDVQKDDVKVELEGGLLTIEGERRKEKEEKGKRFHKIERSYGKFVRHFTLPTEVDGPNVKAEFKDGVLNVRLPKAANAKAKAIDVKVA
jgi:HSP20 family protein